MLWAVTKTNEFCNLFLAVFRHCQNFLRKPPKLVNTRNARLVYSLNFGMRFFSFLKYLFWQKK